MKMINSDTIAPLQPGEAAFVYRQGSGYECTVNVDRLGLVEEEIVLMVSCVKRLQSEARFRDEMVAWTAAAGLRPVPQQ